MSSGSAHNAGTSTLYVNPRGDDRNPGSSDSPFLTIQAAVNAMRNLSAGDLKRIAIAPGLYKDTAVLLEPEDSGLVLEGDGTGEAILCGGIQVTGWQSDGNGRFSAPAPAGACAEKPVDALLVNREFAPQARLPRRGAFRHKNIFPVKWLSSSDGGWERKPSQEELMRLRCREGDLPSCLSVGSARVQLFHQWDESRVGCAGYDPETLTITFSQAPGHPPGAFAEHGDNPKAMTYVLWNLAEGMHEPGQWWHDCERNRIVYWPHHHEDMQAIEVIAPFHQGALTVRGREGLPVRDITIRNLAVIAGSGGNRPAGFGAGAVAGALHLLDVSGVTIEGLHIHHTGGAGIRRSDSGGSHEGLVEKVSIRRCRIHHTGGPGIRIDAARDCVVEDCIVEDIGLIHSSALALSLSGEDSVIRHNLVRRCPYSGIQSAGARGTVIEFNRIEEFMLKLDDGGAIYVFAGKGTVLRGNAAFGASGRKGHAYYLDEQSEGCLVEGNLAVDTASPILNHMSRNCTHRNNIFIDRGDMSLGWPRCRDFTFNGNILLADGSIVFHGEEGSVIQLEGNVICAKKGGVIWARLEPGGYDEKVREPMAEDHVNRMDDPGLLGIEREMVRPVNGGAAAASGLPVQDFTKAGPRL